MYINGKSDFIEILCKQSREYNSERIKRLMNQYELERSLIDRLFEKINKTYNNFLYVDNVTSNMADICDYSIVVPLIKSNGTKVYIDDGNDRIIGIIKFSNFESNFNNVYVVVEYNLRLNSFKEIEVFKRHKDDEIKALNKVLSIIDLIGDKKSISFVEDLKKEIEKRKKKVNDYV